MNHNLKQRLLVAAVASALSTSAYALDPMAVKVTDGVAFTPTLKLGVGYDDNFRALENNEESSWVSTIAPTLTLGGDSGKVKYDVSYTANHEVYHSSRKDDNTDHLLGANAQFEFDARNRLRLNAGFKDVEETASADQKIENDKYTNTSVGAGYTYGADSATGQIRLVINHDRLRYDNGMFGGARLNADKERNSTAYVATFLYRVAPKTKALVEGRFTQHDYVSNKQLDSDNTAVLVGAEWEATAFTTGSVKIGRERKDFDLATKDDASTGMWEVGVTWAPLTYSTFSLNTRAGFDEGSDNADAIDTRSTTLSWNHDWAERLSSNVSYTRTDQDYENANREDNIDTLGLGFTYKMRRWLDVGFGYKYSENDSTRPGKSYKRNIYGLTLNASL